RVDAAFARDQAAGDGDLRPARAGARSRRIKGGKRRSSMLTIYGRGQRYCDRVSRRSFLKIGGFAFGGAACLTLSDLLRVEAATGKRNRHKAVINIFLAGGPPH